MKGSLVKELRLQLGLTQSGFAKLIGVSRGRISQIEQSEHNVVKAEVFARMVEVLKTKPHILLNQPAPMDIPEEEVVYVPIIGFVPCGIPFPCDENRDGYYPVCKSMLRGSMENNLFALRASGNSLIGDEIIDGDYLVVDKEATFINGKIYILLFEENVVARHCYIEDDHMKLISSNGEYQDIIAEDVKVLGRVILSGKWQEH